MRQFKTAFNTSKCLASAINPRFEAQWVDTNSVRPSKRNTRTHSKKQIEQIVSSIRRFGWTFPILIDELGDILCGVGRWRAAQKLGLTTVPVLQKVGLSDAEKRALILADNKIAQNSGWDRQRLAAELGELSLLLPEFNLDLSITGFEPAEIDSLMGAFIDPERDPVDELADPPDDDKAVSRVGDLWLQGNHQLLCGDACNEDHMRILMGRDRAAAIFTDPPFNLTIGATVGRGQRKHREFAFASGEMSSPQFVTFLAKWMKLVARFSEDGSIHYVCIDWRHLAEMLAAGNGAYSELKNVVVWAKTNAGQGSFYRSQHEFVFVWKNGGAPSRNNVELGRHGRNRSNVWTYPGVNTFRKGRLDDLSVHPTVKPVAMVADAMLDCSRRGDIVLDPFMGSGTTILAAERVGRRAYGLEIDPAYVDTSIRRWQVFTKRDAILKSTGQTFDEVAADRLGSNVRRVK